MGCMEKENSNLQLRCAFCDMPGIKKGQYYIAAKTGGQIWEPADSIEAATANYYSDKRM